MSSPPLLPSLLFLSLFSQFTAAAALIHHNIIIIVVVVVTADVISSGGGKTNRVNGDSDAAVYLAL